MAAHDLGSSVAIVVGDGAGLLEVAAPTRVFDVDLSRMGVAPWQLGVVAGEPGPLRSTGGVRIDTPLRYGALADTLAGADLIIVPSWRRPGGRPAPTRLLGELRAAHARGATIAGLCLGAFVLADAGLLAGRRATTHWHHVADLRDGYPDVAVDEQVLYVDEGDVLTSAGSAAGIDACLHLVRRQHGAAAANAVARSMVVAPHRTGGQAQYVEHPLPEPDGGDALDDVLSHALGHLDDPSLDVDAMATRANMSRRTFDRRFRARTGDSPLSWLITQRVLHAERLLESSALGVDAVAREVGFADGVALRPHFRRIVGVAPQTYRKTFAGR
jgi:transcriptional regulator GlxA family with amidase domain